MKCPVCGYIHHEGVVGQSNPAPFILHQPGVVECPSCRIVAHPFQFRKAEPKLIGVEHCA